MAGSVVVHIGQPKAASTSLQIALTENASHLDRCGVRYPLIDGAHHNAAVADLVLSAPPARLSRHPQSEAFIRRIAAPGAWPRLVDEVRSADRAIVSSEWLISFGPDLAARVLHDLTDGDPTAATVVIVVREPSRPLPSIYSELARTLATASFETWLRLTMANLLSPRSTPVLSYLDTEVPRHTWGLAGQILEVPFDPPSGFTFESSLLTALGISHLLAPTVLPHRNRRYGAAWIVAWQRFLRTHPTADAADLRRIVKRARSTIPDVGQFALTPATAVLVDDAFPRSGVITEAAESARRNLLDMVTSTIALTTHGVDDDRFDRAVNDCLVEIERGPS